MTRTLSRAVIALVVLTVIASPVLAGAMVPNWDADATHEPYIDADVTKTTHEMGWLATEYEDDQGDVQDLPAEVNSSMDNPYDLRYTDIEVGAYGDFPINSGTEESTTGGTAVRDSGWSKDASNTAGTLTLSNTTTANNVDAVSFSSSGQTSGDNGQFTFDGYKIDSDVDKRFIQVVADINTLDPGAEVNVSFNDTDGDYVVVHIDPDDNASHTGIMANSTGEGYVFQQQVGDLSVKGSGDGSMDEINHTTVHIKDANADIDVAGFNVEKTTPWTLGEEKTDSDGDGDLETESFTQINTSGDKSIHDLDTMGSAFDAATIHDLDVGMRFNASYYEQPDDYERFNFSTDNASEFPSFDHRVDAYYRIGLPDAFDLSYANTELRDEVVVPDNRYQTVEWGDAVGGENDPTSFENVTWDTDDTSSYDSLDKEVTLTTDVTSGEEFAIHYDYVVTSAEWDAIQDTGGGGGAPMDDGSGGGGFLGGIWGMLAAIGGTVLGWLGIKRTGSGG